MTSTLYVEGRRLHCWLLLYPVVTSRDRQINEEDYETHLVDINKADYVEVLCRSLVFKKRSILCNSHRRLNYLVCLWNHEVNPIDCEREIRKLQCILNTLHAYEEIPRIHYLISCHFGSDLNTIWSWDRYSDADLRKDANIATYGALQAICATKASELRISLCLPGFFTPCVWIKESKQTI